MRVETSDPDRDWSDSDDRALSELLELRRRWASGARTLNELGYTSAKPAAKYKPYEGPRIQPIRFHR